MSSDEEDDQVLLDELHKLQELQNALERKKNLKNTESNSPVAFPNEGPEPKTEEKCGNSIDHNQIKNDEKDVTEIDDDSSVSSYDKYSCENLQDLLDLNKKLLATITAARDQMESLLSDCLKKKQMVQNKISKHSSSWQAKIISFNAGMPYFKDKNYYTAKMNDDTATKIRNGELRLAQLQRINRWNQQDKHNLLKAVRHEVTLTLSDRAEPDENYIDNSIKKTSQLPQDVRKAIGSLGSLKLDWLKIAANIPENKHSAEECEVMWNIFLHPDINKQKWTSKEDKELNRIVEAHNCQNWEAIAKDLKTNRSFYQCFIRYNTNNWKNLMKGQFWTNYDDRTLSFFVSKLRVGDYIPWGYIASCMKNWTKQQVYFRWNYSLAPNLKKGRFSQEEDNQLLDAVDKYGPNFCKISAVVMTNRTHIQLKEHYRILRTKGTTGKKIWTYEEDNKLLKLHAVHGTKWSKIVEGLPGVNRVQARQRYNVLKRYQKSGVDLENINRLQKPDPAAQTTVTFTTNTPWSRENKEIYMHHLTIDDQLIDFFKREIETEKPSKTYSTDKLLDDTKKLFGTLVKLNVNIKLPDYVDDDPELSEKYLELLSSLDAYVDSRINNQEHVEHVRFQMFGHQKPLTGEQRFIPPLPFNFRPPKKVLSRKKAHPFEIDSPIDDERHQIEVVTTLQPDKYVSKCLGEDVEIQLEKFQKLMLAKFSQKNARIVNFPLRCKPFAKSRSFCAESDVTDRASVDGPSSSKKMKYDWELNRLVSTTPPVTKEVDLFGPPISIFEPTRSTLETYQEVINVSSKFPQESENSYSTDLKLTSRGREALSVFKRRYQQLFHMPTGLSRIIPPDAVDESAFLPALEKFKRQNNPQKKKRKRKRKSANIQAKSNDDNEDDDDDENEDDDDDDENEDDSDDD